MLARARHEFGCLGTSTACRKCELEHNITGLPGDFEPAICPVTGYIRGSHEVLGGSNWLSQNSSTMSIQAMKSTPAPSG
jgi:hypothetical protein